MVTFIKSLSLFILVLLPVYLLGIFLALTHNRNLPVQPNIPLRGLSTFTFRDLQGTNNVDIAFIGSSHCYRGFDTRMFEAKGLKVFNLGTSSQTPKVSKLLVNQYLKQLSPTYLVIEVCPLIFSSNVNITESYLEVLVNEYNKSYLIKNNFIWDDIRVHNYLLSHLLDTFLGLKEKEASREYRDTYIKNGFVEREFYYRNDSAMKEMNWHLKKDEFAAFEDILKFAKNSNIEVILVNTPVTSVFYNSYGYNNCFDSIMNGYGKYYNFNKLIKMNDFLDFYDTHHLNQSGILKFNQKFLEIVPLKRKDTIPK